MNKKYSLSLSGAKDLLKDFGTDIENLEKILKIGILKN